MSVKTFNERFSSRFFVLRTPLLPYNRMEELFEQMQKDNFSLIAYLCELFKTDPIILEAIYIASPDLHRQLLRLIAGEELKKSAVQKLEESLYKYIARMSSRCTPFGIFAGCTTGFWDNENDILLKDSVQIKRNMRLDMDYVGELSLQLSKDPAIYKKLKYFPNNSLYRVGKKLRYTEYRFSGNNARTHHLVSIETNSILNTILKKSKNGLPYAEILNLIVETGYSEEEAASYTEELIANQVLLSEIDPNITGKGFPERLLSLLQQEYRINLPLVDSLASVLSKIDAINESERPIDSYKDIFKELSEHPVRINENRVFQIDCYKNAEACTVSISLRTEILKGVEVLQRLNPGHERNRRIHAFKRAFSERYENRTIPLAEALDTEIGLGFRKASNVADMYREEGAFEYNSFMDFKFQKYKNWLVSGSATISITDQDIAQYGKNNSAVANSFNVNVSIAGTPEDYKILIKNAGGPSGANLLGRFANLSQKMEEELRLLCKQEEQLEPGKIFAEVVHLPQARVGNVLARPILREYEIPYLASSTVPVENQLVIDDLYLYMKNSRLVLYSKKHKKEIVPRLSSAHNFSKGLPIYNFLCDLQFQDVQGSIYWDWGFLNSQGHLPRVEYKNVILSPASWTLNGSTVAEVKGKKDWPAMREAIAKLRAHLKMPVTLFLAEGDNHLLLNLETEFGVHCLLREIEQNKFVRLIENIWETGYSMVKDSTGFFTNEMAIPFIRQGDLPATNGVPEKVIVSDKIKRRFIPGSEWLYLKLYASYESTNGILLDHIYPLMKKLQQEQLVSQWFFLRYGDPKHHIRLRMRLAGDTAIAEVMRQLYKKLEDPSRLSVISGIQIDTYIREIERYGIDTMELSEQFFFYNSEFVCDLIKVLAQVKNSKTTFHIALWGVDLMLNNMGYSLSEKIEVTKRVYGTFESQSQGNKNMKKIVSDYYRENSKLMESIFSGAYDKIGEDNPIRQHWPALEKIMQKNTRRMKLLNDQLCVINNSAGTEKKNRLIYSYIHMFVNRLFYKYVSDTENRIYYFLYKLYVSKQVREKMLSV